MTHTIFRGRAITVNGIQDFKVAHKIIGIVLWDDYNHELVWGI